ncbi:MAG: GatB/YqeY domain-containing protein [Campylobacterales bacterium]
MSELKNRINSEVKEAMKNKDAQKRDALRMLTSAIKQVEVDERKELKDEDVVKIIQKAIKQREDAATQYREGGREELASKEEAEIEIFKTYLPAQLSDEELEEKLKSIIDSVGATSMKDMGKIMGVATKEIGSSADGKRINMVVKKLLS